MRVLVGCEESQEICKAFRARGHEAYSCDLKPCSGGYPEWHIVGDVREVINPVSTKPVSSVKSPSKCPVGTTEVPSKSEWDLFIVHPECIDICVSGARHFTEKIADGRQQAAINFFMEMINAPVPMICVENPVGIMSTIYRKPDQYIQPYEYGHPETKKTRLWLKNLPKLVPTNNVYDEMMKLPKSQRERVHHMPPSPERAMLRAKTYSGWARAMAEQWG